MKVLIRGACHGIRPGRTRRSRLAWLRFESVCIRSGPGHREFLHDTYLPPSAIVITRARKTDELWFVPDFVGDEVIACPPKVVLDIVRKSVRSLDRGGVMVGMLWLYSKPPLVSASICKDDFRSQT